MSEDSGRHICKYCESEMKATAFPPGHDLGFEYVYICFNDECGYYKRGWDHMKENFKVNSSYRYMFNPHNGSVGPIPVFSPYTFKPQIFEFKEEK